MILEQISIELVNQPGEMSKVSDLLGEERINIRAMCVSPGNGQSIVRMVVDNSEKAGKVLTSRGYKIWTEKVIAVETPDHPGGLNSVLKPLKEAKINVAYLYPFIGRFHTNAVLILGVDKIEEAIQVLRKNYIKILEKELYVV
jgi:hypothetical protein